MTDTSYMKTRQQFSRPEYMIDMPRLALDLIPAFAAIGETCEIGEPDMDDRHGQFAKLVFRQRNLTMTLGQGYWPHKWTPKANVYVGVLGVEPGDRPAHYGTRYTELYGLPEATVTVTRPLDVIARDLKRRVLVEAEEPIRNLLDYAAERKGSRSAMDVRIAELQAKYPDLEFYKVENGEAATFSRRGPYIISGKIYATGDFHIDRLTSMPDALFEKFMALVAEHGETK